MPIEVAAESTPQTIEEAQNSIKSAILKLADVDPNRVKPFLCPDGYELVVELQEEGRKKRRNASSENWSPEKGEVFIYFEKRPPGAATVSAPIAARPGQAPAKNDVSKPEAENPVKQLTSVLQEVERTRDFVSLKWFRDDVLASRSFPWAKDAAERQNVMRKAIEAGYVLTSRVHNPHTPQYPTTSIRTNRAKLAGTSAAAPARYTPVPVRGEPVSVTLLRDRGPR
jgi:hypothetical protein